MAQVKPSYKILDEFHHGSLTDPTDGVVYPSVYKIIAESKQLQEAQELFELFQSDYIPLQRCSEELLYLKSLWDMVSHCPPPSLHLLSSVPNLPLGTPHLPRRHLPSPSSLALRWVPSC